MEKKPIMSLKSKENFLREVEALWDRYMNLGDSKDGDSSPVKKTQKEVKEVKPVEVDTEDLSLNRLSRCNVAELKALCKAKGQKVSGKKEDLLQRLIEFSKGGSVEVPKVVKETKKVVKPAGPSKVLAKVSAKPLQVTIRKNNYGNLEHPQTGLVFEGKNNTAVGVQEDSGSVRPLTDEDIEVCKKWKFTYSVPNNLDESKMKVEETEKKDQRDQRSKVEKIIEDGLEEEVLDPEEEVSDVESEEELIED